MDLRLFPAAFFLFASAAIAQVDVPPQQPAPDAPKGEAPAQERAAGDIIGDLQKEKERLQREIQYAKDRAKNANKMLAEKLGQRTQTFRSIDAGTDQPPRPAAMPMKKARIMTEEERGNHGNDVLLVVDGLPVRQEQFNTLMDYLKSLTNAGDATMMAQRILFELIRVNSVAAAFPENDAEAQIADVYAQLQSGKSMADVGKTFGTVLGSKEDGTVEVTRNSFLGVDLERVAFALKEGEYSRPFRNVFGFVVIGVDKIEKGATPDLDKLSARTVQVRYAADEAMLNQAQAAASRGSVDLAVRDDSVLEMLPAMYRPMPAQPEGTVDPATNMKMTLQALDGQIKSLEAAGDTTPDTEATLKALKQQRDSIQAMMADIQRQSGDMSTGDADGTVPVNVAPLTPDSGPAVKPATDAAKAAEIKKAEAKAAELKKAAEVKAAEVKKDTQESLPPAPVKKDAAPDQPTQTPGTPRK